MTQDLFLNLFRAYKAALDKDFIVEYINKKKDDYDEGKTLLCKPAHACFSQQTSSKLRSKILRVMHLVMNRSR